MPIRHSGNERKEIGNWDQWIEQEIVDAHDRGDFDDVEPGKPFDLSTNALDPAREFALSRLKNAGVKPAWMDLDGECHQLRADLDDFLERSSIYLQLEIDTILERESPPSVPHDSVAASVPIDLWSRIVAWLRFPATGAETMVEDGPRDRLDLVHLRQQMKDQYLERAATLDKRIVLFNNTLAREMMHLERVRLIPERASRLFEARCPEIPLPRSSDTTGTVA